MYLPLCILLDGLFCLAGGTGLGLGSNVNCHFAVVAAAVGACAVGYAHVAALALYQRVGGQGMVRTAVSRVRPGVSHPNYHAGTIANKSKKRKPP